MQSQTKLLKIWKSPQQAKALLNWRASASEILPCTWPWAIWQNILSQTGRCTAMVGRSKARQKTQRCHEVQKTNLRNHPARFISMRGFCLHDIAGACSVFCRWFWFILRYDSPFTFADIKAELSYRWYSSSFHTFFTDFASVYAISGQRFTGWLCLKNAFVLAVGGVLAGLFSHFS
jgi:hypothetical protein